VQRSQFANFTRTGNKLYVHVHFWPGDTVSIGGLTNKVVSAKLYGTGQTLKVNQDPFRTQITGLPSKAPDPLVSVIELECDGEPGQDMENIRKNRPRRDIGV
jgi:alpha-L-fucosidase